MAPGTSTCRGSDSGKASSGDERSTSRQRAENKASGSVLGGFSAASRLARAF